MIQRLSSFVLLVLMTFGSVLAQDSHPDTLSGFIKPNMHLGIRLTDASTEYSVVILTPEEYAIHVDSRELSIEELTAKYPDVAKRRDDAIANAKKAIASQTVKLRPGQGYGETKARADVDHRVLLCKVIHVGADYILIEYANSSARRRAFSTRYLTSIRWGDPVRISTSTPRIKLPSR